MKKAFKAAIGFTLVELLIVIAILAILASLLLPVLSAGKAKVQRTACVNNLRQLSLGVRMYSDDSRDASPSQALPGVPLNKMDSFYFGYKTLMKSYVGLNGASSSRDKLFACPADTINPGVLFDDREHFFQRVKRSCHDERNFDYSSYAFNGGDNVTRQVAGRNFTPPGLSGVKLSSVRHPERTLLLTEIPALYPYSWHEPSSPGTAAPNRGLFYNDSKNVVSFVDGHVSYIKMHYKHPICALLTNPPAGYNYQWTPD